MSINTFLNYFEEFNEENFDLIKLNREYTEAFEKFAEILHGKKPIQTFAPTTNEDESFFEAPITTINNNLQIIQMPVEQKKYRKINKLKKSKGIIKPQKSTTHTDHHSHIFLAIKYLFLAYRKGHWTGKEHQLYLESLRKHGGNCSKLAKIIKTRDVTQIRSHHQKFERKIFTTNESERANLYYYLNKIRAQSAKESLEKLKHQFLPLSTIQNAQNTQKHKINTKTQLKHTNTELFQNHYNEYETDTKKAEKNETKTDKEKEEEKQVYQNEEYQNEEYENEEDYENDENAENEESGENEYNEDLSLLKEEDDMIDSHEDLLNNLNMQMNSLRNIHNIYPSNTGMEIMDIDFNINPQQLCERDHSLEKDRDCTDQSQFILFKGRSKSGKQISLQVERQIYQDLKQFSRKTSLLNLMQNNNQQSSSHVENLDEIDSYLGSQSSRNVKKDSENAPIIVDKNSLQYVSCQYLIEEIAKIQSLLKVKDEVAVQKNTDFQQGRLNTESLILNPAEDILNTKENLKNEEKANKINEANKLPPVQEEEKISQKKNTNKKKQQKKTEAENLAKVDPEGLSEDSDCQIFEMLSKNDKTFNQLFDNFSCSKFIWPLAWKSFQLPGEKNMNFIIQENDSNLPDSAIKPLIYQIPEEETQSRSNWPNKLLDIEMNTPVISCTKDLKNRTDVGVFSKNSASISSTRANRGGYKPAPSKFINEKSIQSPHKTVFADQTQEFSFGKPANKKKTKPNFALFKPK